MIVDALSVLLRAMSFIVLFQAVGAALFLVCFGRRLPGTHDLVRRAAALSALLAVMLLVSQYVLEAARMAGELTGMLDPTLQALVLHSATATAFACRLVGLALVAVGLRLHGTPSSVLSVAGTAVVVASFALMGHTASHPDRGALAPMLILHLFVVAFWFGAIGPLYVASVGEPFDVAGSVIEAFSAVAFWVVPVLFIAGLVLAIGLLGGLAGLRTTYGALLLAKLSGFAVLMGLAALNKWRLGPAVASGNSRAVTAFRRSLAAEYVLIAAVLGTTAVMTTFYSPD